jgi:ATP-dependent DNA helicase RecQ
MHGILQLSSNYHKQSTVLFNVNSSEISSDKLSDNLNNVITVLQRKYAGIYNHPVDIDEKFIAKELLIPRSALKQYLERLEELGVISYQSNNQNHFIHFLQDRLRLFLGSFDTIETYGQMQKFGYESMNSYLEDREVCRNQMISGYFGMNLDLPCGSCDNCRRLKSDSGFKNAFKEKAKNIRQVMAQSNSRKEVLDSVKKNPYAALVLQELLERKVAVFKNNEWHWYAK